MSVKIVLLSYVSLGSSLRETTINAIIHVLMAVALATLLSFSWFSLACLCLIVVLVACDWSRRMTLLKSATSTDKQLRL